MEYNEMAGTDLAIDISQRMAMITLGFWNKEIKTMLGPREP